MKGRAQLWRAAGCALCALAAAGCGGASKTRSGTAALQPSFARSVVLKAVSGTVRVKLPASASFTLLRGTEQARVGTVIDTRAGVVRLTAADPGRGSPAVGDFQDGVFQVLQSRAGNGLTDLRIQDTQSAAVACRTASGARQLTARQLGLLLGDGTGQFRTDGDFAAATVRGTAWGVRDRCDGTLTIVRRGTVIVTDLRLHKNITLHAGQTYLAKAP